MEANKMIKDLIDLLEEIQERDISTGIYRDIQDCLDYYENELIRRGIKNG